MIDRVYITEERILVPIPPFEIAENKVPLLFRTMREFGCLMKVWIRGEEILREVKKIKKGEITIKFDRFLLSLIPGEKIPVRTNKLSIGKEKLINLIKGSVPTCWLFYEDELEEGFNNSNIKRENIIPNIDLYPMIFKNISEKKFEEIAEFENKFLWEVWNLTH